LPSIFRPSATSLFEKPKIKVQNQKYNLFYDFAISFCRITLLLGLRRGVIFDTRVQKDWGCADTPEEGVRGFHE
jgi:hypothetical protein